MKNLVLRAALVAGIGLAAATPAAAQQQQPGPNITDNDVQLPFFNVQQMTTVLAPFNVELTQQRRDDGDIFLRMVADGVSVNLFFTDCGAGPQQCLGLYMFALWETPPGRTRQQMIDDTNAFNVRYDYAKSGVTSDNRLYMGRYITSAFGTKRGAVRAELRNFMVFAPVFARQVVLRQPEG